VTPIFKALNKKVNIEFIEMPETLREKYQYFTKGDISKLRANGFKDSITPLADSVTDYVNNYLTPGKFLGD
jgi:ADP-L-glycero-D-manno-heptose 6-epimerase